MYRRILALALLLALVLTGCAQAPASVDEACVAATTYPVWQFTCAVTEGTGLRVERVISEPVSCVHDYALSVEQMKILSRSRAVVISGLGLEDFMADVLPDGERCIDASAGIKTLSAEAHDHDHDHGDHCSCGCGHDHDHDHAGHHHADEVFTSWGVETPKKFSEEEIREKLSELDDCRHYGTILRAKGFVDSPDGEWVYFDYVPGEVDIRRGGAAVTGRICVIGSKINEQAIKELFNIE